MTSGLLKPLLNSSHFLNLFFHNCSIPDDNGPAERKYFATVDHFGDDLRADSSRIAHGDGYERSLSHMSSFKSRDCDVMR